ncbi:MAG: hypothetical protein ACFB9M_02620 [Myxococcota bacterium]
MIAALSLVACGANHHSIYRNDRVPVEANDPSLGAVTIDAKQRFMLVGVSGGDRIVCTEPSPDALSARAAALSGSLSKGDIGAAIGTSSSESAASIGLRTQTVQLLRDAYFRLCEAYLNKALNKEQYLLALSYIDEVMIQMLVVDTVGGTPRPPPVVVSPSLAGMTSKSSFSATDSEDDDKVDSSGESSVSSVTGSSLIATSTAGTGLNEHEAKVLMKALALTNRSSLNVFCFMLILKGKDVNETAEKECLKVLKKMQVTEQMRKTLESQQQRLGKAEAGLKDTQRKLKELEKMFASDCKGDAKCYDRAFRQAKMLIDAASKDVRIIK